MYKCGKFFINTEFKIEAPSDVLPVYVPGGSTTYTVGLTIEIVFSTALVTIVLLLYIYFQDEPEIKSTSLVLSLFMFLGCYLAIFYLIILLLFDQPSDSLHHLYYANLCTLLQWSSGLGIPVPLIVATLLIRLLRIYYIFNKFSHHGPAPIGRQCSDMFLAFLVFLTISPNVLILVIWTLTDRYTLTVNYSMYNYEYIQVDKQCNSAHLEIWIGCWILYLLFLLLALLVVAVKTRNIRLRHYKDTKKVNAFIFVLNLNIFFTVSYWLFLRSVTKRHIVDIASHIGHSALVILCQAFLFAPKVFPPLFQCLSRKIPNRL